MIPPKYLGWNASATLFPDWVKSPAARLAHCLLGLSWLSGCLFSIQFYNSICLGFVWNIHNEYLRSPLVYTICIRNSHHLVHSTRNVQAKSKQNFLLEKILRLQNWHTKAFDPIPFSFIVFSMPEVFIIVLCVCPHLVHRKITTICGYQWKCIAQTTTAMLSGCLTLH